MTEEKIPERQRSLPENPAEITNLTGVLSQDQRRVQVTVVLSNGATHPDLELTLESATGQELSRTTILENFGPRLVFTMHIRQAQVQFPLRLNCKLSYLDDETYSAKEIQVENA